MTLSVVPTSRLPPGMRVACVGDGAVLGNWQAEHAVPLDYSMGSHSTSFVIPNIAKGTRPPSIRPLTFPASPFRSKPDLTGKPKVERRNMTLRTRVDSPQLSSTRSEG